MRYIGPFARALPSSKLPGSRRSSTSPRLASNPRPLLDSAWVSDQRVRQISRRLRDLCEPIAGSVYFAREAFDAYKRIGLEGYAEGYFTSRGACLGKPSGQLVCAAFGVFNPDVVIPAVDAGWSKTDPASVLEARLDGATRALERMLGEADPERAVQILRPAMESVDYAGRALFAGLRSLQFPDDPIAQLWRVCDYVRERRGDGHIAAWVSAGADAAEISVLTELLWGLQPKTYSTTRGWTTDQLDAAIGRLEANGYIAGSELTEHGREYRRSIESATDAGEAVVVSALGDDVDELFAVLEPMQRAVLDARGYPTDPASIMNRDQQDAS